ncbi:MAG: hypothetical protein NT075_13780 [Chloroflexi bacterium]|nr:hypothetical protein [Chloroflexota bacterium]
MRINVISRPMLMVGLLSLLLASCITTNSANLTTDTRSTQFATDREKLTFLAKYLTLYSTVEAAEYHIVYHDNSAGGVPGPSEWDIQVVLKMTPENLVLWTADMQLVAPESVDLGWGYSLLPNESRWKVPTQPQVYSRANVVVAIFPEQGILFKRVWTQ